MGETPRQRGAMNRIKERITSPCEGGIEAQECAVAGKRASSEQAQARIPCEGEIEAQECAAAGKRASGKQAKARRDSVYGGRATPRSVKMAVM